MNTYMDSIPCLTVILLNEITVLTDCGGIFQEIAQSGKKRFVVCDLITTDIANYYKLVPLYGYYNTFENGDFKTRTIHKNYFDKTPHKDFNIINERYKAEGFCIAMNERLNMMYNVKSDYNNCWIDIGSHVFWFDGKDWYDGDYYKDTKQKTKFITIVKRLMLCDWEYNPEIVKLCKVNSFKRIINKLFK